MRDCEMPCCSPAQDCFAPARNQPLLVYRFVNYLRRTQRGITNAHRDLIRLVSEEMLTEHSETRSAY